MRIVEAIFRRIHQEPVRFVAAINGTIASAILFGLPLTAEQGAGISVAVSLWLAFSTRSKVTPV